MKLWVDAKREPDPDWVWCKAACSAIAMLRGGNVEQISFAPDQRKLVSEVRRWLADHTLDIPHLTHTRTAGVRYPRGLLQIVNKAAAL